MIKTILPLCALLLSTFVFADYDYRYIEGEAFDRGEVQGLRDEGFTPWMGHPSGGKVAVFGQPAGGFLEYAVKGLQPGDHYLHIRCLALPTTKTHVLWDGNDLGFITHEAASTSLRWSVPVTIAGGGDHVLRLQGSEDSTCWPYIDVILFTNQAGYTPSWEDSDFVSHSTAWPLLKLGGEPPQTLAPDAAPTPALRSDLRLDGLTLQPPFSAPTRCN